MKTWDEGYIIISAMDKSGDRELVQRCIGGSPEAWKEFVDRFSGLIFWAIKRKLNKYPGPYIEAEVEDIYQLIFASIWEKKSLMTVSERGNIAPWLVVLASNFTIDVIRKRSIEVDFLRNTDKISIKSQDTRAIAVRREQDRLLDEAVMALNEKEKAYLELSYTSGKKHKEIAEIFNTSINSVSTTIARAINKIKKYINSKM